MPMNVHYGIEKLFGWIKQWGGFRQFKLPGTERVSSVIGLNVIPCILLHLSMLITTRQQMLEAVNAHLKASGMPMKNDAIVDASLIPAPTFTKIHARERDPEMHRA